MAIRVYEYGLLEPADPDVALLVMEQMRRAHTYRNLLTELERDRRAKTHTVMSSHPDVSDLHQQVADLTAKRDAAREAISSVRRQARRRAETPEQRELVRDLGRQIKELRQKIREQRKDVVAAVKPKLQEIEQAHIQRVKAERARCGVYWGTYLLQESDADRARQEVAMPKFRPWRGEGRVSVQLQGGLSVEEALAMSDTQLRLEPTHSDAHDIGVRRGDRRRAQRTVLQIRIGSIGRRPIWAAWPMIYHRPIPPGSAIKIATVSRRRRDCRRWTWVVQFTVDIPETYQRRPVLSGVAALNLGFCQRPNGVIRAGYVVGDDGMEREIVTPHSVIDAINKASSIQSYRDKWLDKMKGEMGKWFAEIRARHEAFMAKATDEASGAGSDGWSRLWSYIQFANQEFSGGVHSEGFPLAMPAWAYRALSMLHQWRSADRFRSLAFHWRDHRFPGDEIGFRILEGYKTERFKDDRDAWRYRDEHLERYQTGMRRRALLRRREAYRLIAAELASRYHTLVIDDTDLRTFQRSPAPESDRVEFDAVKHNQFIAACSELRLVMKNAFGPARTREVSPQTAPCASCGVVNEWDRATPDRLHACTGCKQVWDQDANACRNMLRLADDAEETPDQPAKLSRSQRLHQARAQRSASTAASSP